MKEDQIAFDLNEETGQLTFDFEDMHSESVLPAKQNSKLPSAPPKTKRPSRYLLLQRKYSAAPLTIDQELPQVQVHLNASCEWFDQGWYRHAAEECRAALAIAPNSALTLILLALVYLHLRKPWHAVWLSLRALRIAPISITTWDALAICTLAALAYSVLGIWYPDPERRPWLG